MLSAWIVTELVCAQSGEALAKAIAASANGVLRNCMKPPSLFSLVSSRQSVAFLMTSELKKLPGLKQGPCHESNYEADQGLDYRVVAGIATGM
jgi:hypothetical protein